MGCLEIAACIDVIAATRSEPVAAEIAIVGSAAQIRISALFLSLPQQTSRLWQTDGAPTMRLSTHDSC